MTFHNATDERAVHTTSNAIIVSMLPDICWTPFGPIMLPIPYFIIGFCHEVENASGTTGTQETADLTMASRLTTVYGDEPGTGGGLISGVNKGYCRPITHSTSVKVDGQFVVTNKSIFWMNCNGPDGPGNTIGKVVYLTAQDYAALYTAKQEERTCACDPVDVATGSVVLSAQDIEFGHASGLALTRHYASHGAHHAGLFGPGWSCWLDMYLELRSDDILLHDSEGRNIVFPPIEVGQSHFHAGEKLTLRRDQTGISIHDNRGHSYHFAPGQEAQKWRLQQLSRNFSTLEFSYQDQQLEWIKDETGTTWQLQYDQAKHLIAILGTSPADKTGRSRILLRRYAYDAYSRLIAVQDEQDDTWYYQYDDWNRLSKKTTRTGYAIHYQYGDDGRCAKSWGEDGLYYGAFKYYSRQRKTEVTDAEGNTTSYHYNHDGLVTKEIDPLGGVKEYHYDRQRKLIAETGLDGWVNNYQYDTKGRQTARIDQANNHWKEAPGVGLAEEIDPLGNRLIHLRDQWGNTIRSWDEDGNQQTHLYQGESIKKGKKVKSTDWLAYPGSNPNKTTAPEYDRKGRLIAETDANGNRCEYRYDAEDNLVQVIDPLGFKQKTAYAGFNKKIAEQNPNGDIIRYQYNRQGKLSALINENEQQHRFQYDALGRLVADIGFDGEGRQYQYDAAGNISQITEADGAELHLEYDRTGNLLEIAGTDKDGLQINNRYAYDAAGRLVEASNPYDSVRFAYDALGQVIKEQTERHTIQRQYDARGNLIARNTSWGSKVGFGYAEDKLIEVILPEGRNIRYQRDANGYPVEIHYPGGTKEQRDYDAMGQLLRQELTPGARESTPITRRYQYDARGKLIQLESNQEETKQYNYDGVGQLTGVTYPHHVSKNERFHYDPAGNLLHTHQGIQGNYAPDNTIRAFNGAKYEHDRRGNLTYKQTKEQTCRYRYNLLNQLIGCQLPNRTQAEYHYDALGRRIAKIVDGKITRFYWDQFQIVAEESDGEQTEYVFEPDSYILLTMVKADRAYFYHHDHLGTPQEITDMTGRIAWVGWYDAFGQCEISPIANIASQWRFQGQYHDEETGLHYNVFRYYQPELGRYLTRDPISYLSGDLNLYRYVGQDYVNDTDALGLFVCGGLCIGAIAVGVVAAGYAIYYFANKESEEECEGCDDSNSIDRKGEDSFKRDENGDIVATKIGDPFLTQHAGAPGVHFSVTKYELELVDGTKIEAYKSHGKYDSATRKIVPDARLDTDCHGVTFSGGEYWINDDQVEQILSGGGYKPTISPEPGDVLIYRNSSGDVVHSVTVTQVDAQGVVSEVIGLGGLEIDQHTDHPDDAWYDSSATQEIWTK